MSLGFKLLIFLIETEISADCELIVRNFLYNWFSDRELLGPTKVYKFFFIFFCRYK